MTKPKVLSFFSGGGGLDLGFEAAGFDVIFSCDLMEESCATLRRNRDGRFIFGPPNFSGDIHDLNAANIHKYLKTKPSDIDVVIGGPPCQPFSVAASQRFLKTDSRFKRKGFHCKEKGSLIHKYTDLILELKPKVFLIENVPGIMTIDAGGQIKTILNKLQTQGQYNISEPRILDAKDFGVPQTRKRVFIVGCLGPYKIDLPQKTHGKEAGIYLLKHRTVGDALKNFSFRLPNSEIRKHANESIQRYKEMRFGQREKLGRVDRLNPNLPSKTIIAGGTSGGGRSHLHPFQARTLSVRECARLQTFPDNWVFFGKSGRQFTQVGNAVPPLLAEKIARQILQMYFKKKAPKECVYDIEKSDDANTKEILVWSKKTNPQLLYKENETD